MNSKLRKRFRSFVMEKNFGIFSAVGRIYKSITCDLHSRNFLLGGRVRSTLVHSKRRGLIYESGVYRGPLMKLITRRNVTAVARFCASNHDRPSPLLSQINWITVFARLNADGWAQRSDLINQSAPAPSDSPRAYEKRYRVRLQSIHFQARLPSPSNLP